MKTMRWKISRWLFFVTGFLFLVVVDPSQGAQQYEGLCAAVKMEILQEMTLERVGFLATLKITNNETDGSITNFSAVLTFASEDATQENASGLFFIKPPEFSGVTAVDGTGIIPPGQTATIKWFIIPRVQAGGTTPEGLRYAVGANLAASIYNQQIAPQVLEVLPDVITVRPEPQLEITYFQPRDVDGDDPFTTDVAETPVPFSLGVLVKNTGYGLARNIRVVSQQPRIVENVQNTLLVAQLLGARVDDEPTNHASLTLDLGDIEPGRCRKGAWDMMTSLSGEFIEFSASYTHDSDLGGRDTSVIAALNAYFMVHEVKNDQPGRDDLLDFLADTVADTEFVPDTLYESDGYTLPVNRLVDVDVLGYDPSTYTAQLHANATVGNWVFIRVDDPAQAKYRVSSVVRSDGKVLNPNNCWTHIRYHKPDNTKITWLNIFDFVAVGEYQYTVTYAPPGSDMEPPETFLRFAGEVEEQDGTVYLLPETQIYFTAEDDGPVTTWRKLDTDLDFVPAYPFTVSAPGEYTLEYYSVDETGNEEAHQTATLVVSADYPEITVFSMDTDVLSIAGDAISIRPQDVTVSFESITTAAGLNAAVDIYQGAYGFPTVAGVPSTPTASTTAILSVGGENVDFYEYRINGGQWNDEAPVFNPIVLDSLIGTVQLTIRGRNQYGDYHGDEDALTVSWVVDPAASGVVISGMPATPSRDNAATFTVSETDHYCYRIDAGAYLPDSGAGTPVIMNQLADGEHTVDVLARPDAGTVCPADGDGTRVRWTVDRSYGLQFPPERQVRHADLGQVGTGPVTFSWDGRNDAGGAVSPGWYTIKLTVSDMLGRSMSTIGLVRIESMLADGTLLSDAGAVPQEEAHAAGRWVVWQDQRDGNWDIYAMDLNDETETAVVVRNNAYHQERPRTDGTIVVWEDRQADGTWDVWARALGTADAAFAVTATPDSNDRKPAVCWPWVVYQTKPVSTPSAPWQLKAYNLITHTSETVDATVQDQVDPWIHNQRIVWQDFRDVGPGEIYFKDLKTGDVSRITHSAAGQYFPVIHGQWIVWADNRGSQLDLYGYNLLRGAEVQLTDTPEDETHPRINGRWVVYSEDSLGEGQPNLRMLSLSSFASIQLTNMDSEKEGPSMASGKLTWTDDASGVKQIRIGTLPDLQPVFNNQNTVAVTEGMAAELEDAYTLLRLWNQEAGVSAITHYTSLVPDIAAETVSWSEGQPAGNNFALEAGSFLWVRFSQAHILDLGYGPCNAVDLAAGINAYTYTCFPDQYTAYRAIQEIGKDAVRALRMLDSDTGKWQVVSVVDDRIVGPNFTIPRIAVVMMDMKSARNSWKPGE
jgi:beta propeller repeat protein